MHHGVGSGLMSSRDACTRWALRMATTEEVVQSGSVLGYRGGLQHDRDQAKPPNGGLEHDKLSGLRIGAEFGSVDDLPPVPRRKQPVESRGRGRSDARARIPDLTCGIENVDPSGLGRGASVDDLTQVPGSKVWYEPRENDAARDRGLVEVTNAIRNLKVESRSCGTKSAHQRYDSVPKSAKAPLGRLHRKPAAVHRGDARSHSRAHTQRSSHRQPSNDDGRIDDRSWQCPDYYQGRSCLKEPCLAVHGELSRPLANRAAALALQDRAAQRSQDLNLQLNIVEIGGGTRIAIDCGTRGTGGKDVAQLITFIDARIPCAKWLRGEKQSCPHTDDRCNSGHWLPLPPGVSSTTDLGAALLTRLQSTDPGSRIIRDEDAQGLFIQSVNKDMAKFVSTVTPLLLAEVEGLEAWLRGRRGWGYSASFNTGVTGEELRRVGQRLHDALSSPADCSRLYVLRKLFCEEVDARNGRNPQRLQLASGSYQNKVLSVRKFLEHMTWFADSVLHAEKHSELLELVESCCVKSTAKSVAEEVVAFLTAADGRREASRIRSLIYGQDGESRSLLRNSSQGPDVPCHWSAHSSTNNGQYCCVTNLVQEELIRRLDAIVDSIVVLRNKLRLATEQRRLGPGSGFLP